MSDKPEAFVHIASAHKREGLPEFDMKVRCTLHPEVPPMDGYGMAGGGIGLYTVCRKCGRVLTKSEDPSG